MAMTSGGRVGDALRRVIAPRLRFIPGIRTMAIDSTTPRLRWAASPIARLRQGRLAGQLSPNAALPDGNRLDDLIGGRSALLTRVECPADVRAAAEARGAVVVTVPASSALARWLRRGWARAAVVRPTAPSRAPAVTCARWRARSCGRRTGARCPWPPPSFPPCPRSQSASPTGPRCEPSPTASP